MEESPALPKHEETSPSRFPDVGASRLPLLDQAAEQDMPSQAPLSQKQKVLCECGSPSTPGAKYCCSCGRPAGTPAPLHSLVYRAEDGRETIVPIRGEDVTIGKTGDCDLPLPHDGYASRRHARVYETADGVFVEDLGSANGTFLRVSTPQKLEPGDEIIVGKTAITFRDAAS